MKQEFLFVGGVADGRRIVMDDNPPICKVKDPSDPGLFYVKTYTKRAVLRGFAGRDGRDFYFAISSLTDEEALQLFLAKR